MSEIDAEVVRRLVTGRKNDGRAVYDPQAKAEVVRACLKPGVSVARMALQCGINANLLRRWITQRMGNSPPALGEPFGQRLRRLRCFLPFILLVCVPRRIGPGNMFHRN